MKYKPILILLALSMIPIILALTSNAPADEFYSQDSNVLLNVTNNLTFANVSFFVNTSDSFPGGNEICFYNNTGIGDLTCQFAGAANELISENLVSYWKFDRDDPDADSAGSNDVVTNLNSNFTLNGGSILDAYHFGETSIDELRMGDILDSTFSGDFSISVWIKVDSDYTSQVTNTIFFKNDDRPTLNVRNTGAVSAGGWFNSNPPCSGTVNSITTTKTVVVDEWMHVVLTAESTGNFWKLYLDGNLEASAAICPAFSPGSTVFIGGQLTATREFEGFIDELRIYNATLTSSQINSLYDSGEGTYFWKANATNGTLSQELSTQVFHIDLTNPEISTIGTPYKSRNGHINISVTDNNNISTNVSLDGVLISQQDNTANETYINTTDLALGRYNLTVISEDLSGRITTKTKFFNVIRINDVLIYADSNKAEISLFADINKFIIKFFGGR